jgi:hypothetical protein
MRREAGSGDSCNGEILHPLFPGCDFFWLRMKYFTLDKLSSPTSPKDKVAAYAW